jgi:ABC-2 type transport system permease protein
MADRGNFFTWCVVHSTNLLTMTIFISLVFSRVQSINGWTQDQALLVLGVGTLISGLGSLTFFPFMYDFGKKILRGEFDAILIKPVNTLFASAFCWVDVEDLITVPNSIILIIYALIRIDNNFSIFNLFIFIVLILSSLLILFSLLTLIQSLSFKHIRINSVQDFFWAMVDTNKYPVKAMKEISTFVWILVFPIALISSVPAEVLFGRYDWPWITSSFVFSLFLFWLSKKVFYSSLRHYSSASS